MSQQPYQPYQGNQPQQPYPQPYPHQPYQGQQPYRGPAKSAHGVTYWLLVGWWWEVACWAGRMSLWLLCFPLGIWRTLRKSRKNREARERRGY